MATFDINDVARRVQYTSTGQTGPFNFNFQVNASSELLVYIDDTEKTETTHYTVSLNADGTGSVTFTSATTTGELITIIGDQALSRTTVFQVGQVNNPTSLETEFDNTLIRQQQIKEITDRALQLKPTTPRTVTGSGTSGPLYWPYDATASNNASRVIAYDSAGTSLELGPTTVDIATIAGIASDVSTVSGIASDVTAVAADASDIGIVSTNIGSVNTVATNINDVIAVANDLNEAVSEVETVANDLNEAVSEIDTVATSISNVDTVGNNISNVNTVAGISSNVTTVAGISSNVTTVAGVSSDIPTVAAIDSDVTTVAGISGNVTTVAGISSDVTAVASDSTDIGTVATNIANVNTVAGISANVTTVAGISSDVTAVAADATDIGTVATNIANVNNVGGSIANVNTVASNISGVNSFAERYRVDSADPTTSLDQGDLAYNTTANALKYYDGSAWQQIVAGGLTDIVQDGTPQLGGNLDLNSNDITGTGNIDITGTATVTGLTTTGDINFGDNDKANFGAGNDLQIYSDGANGFIKEVDATGYLYIQGTNLRLQNTAGTQTYVNANDNGAVDLRYAGSPKIATTSTGIDVTGTVVSDGLTVDGNAQINGDVTVFDGTGDPFVKLQTNEQQTVLRIDNSASDIFQIRDATNSANRLGISTGGDISFYEDTGTTAKLFWDASAESLGIGRSDASYKLHVSDTSFGAGSPGVVARFGNNSSNFQIARRADGDAIGPFENIPLIFEKNNGSETMRIDNSGIVKIGTSGTATPYVHSKLAIDTGLYAYMDLISTGSSGINFGDASLSQVGSIEYNHSVNYLRFITNASERMRIDSSGNAIFKNGALLEEGTLTDGATIAWDVNASPVAKVTLGGNRTISAPSNSAGAGQFISLLVIQDGTGSRTLTWNAVYEFASDTAPTLTTTGGQGDLFVFRYNGTKWLEVGRNLNLTLS